jgi:hypothetical protein
MAAIAGHQAFPASELRMDFQATKKNRSATGKTRARTQSDRGDKHRKKATAGAQAGRNGISTTWVATPGLHCESCGRDRGLDKEQRQDLLSRH